MPGVSFRSTSRCRTSAWSESLCPFPDNAEGMRMTRNTDPCSNLLLQPKHLSVCFVQLVVDVCLIPCPVVRSCGCADESGQSQHQPHVVCLSVSLLPSVRPAIRDHGRVSRSASPPVLPGQSCPIFSVAHISFIGSQEIQRLLVSLTKSANSLPVADFPFLNTFRSFDEHMKRRQNQILSM